MKSQTKFMKKIKLFTGIMLILAMFMEIIIPKTRVKADEFINVDFQEKITLSVPNGPDYIVIMSKKQLGGKSISEVTSNKKNVSVECVGDDRFILYVGKEGKITITIALTGNGKTTKKKMVATFVKYENPIVKSIFVTSSMMKVLNQYPSVSKDTKKKSEK